MNFKKPALFCAFIAIAYSTCSMASADRTIYIYNDTKDTLKIMPSFQSHTMIEPLSSLMPYLKPGEEGSYRIHDDGKTCNFEQIAGFQVLDIKTLQTGDLSFHHYRVKRFFMGYNWYTYIKFKGRFNLTALCGKSQSECILPGRDISSVEAIKDKGNSDITVHFKPSNFTNTPAFADNFDGNQLDLTKWMYRQLGKRNNCINIENAVSVKDNMLTITTYSQKNSGETQDYCGMISTQNSLLQRYGYWEANIKFNYTKGMQVAFWLQSPTIGADPNDPENSGVELDIFEHLSGAAKNNYDHAAHWNGYGEHYKRWDVFLNQKINDGKFHKFGLSWTPYGYTFYVDGVITSHTLSNSSVPVSHTKEYVILSSESSGSKGYGELEKSKAKFFIDYVKVYPYIE